MDWMSQLSGVLQQYSGAGAAPARTSVPDDFNQIAQTAPKSELADGLAAAFRSDETPEFGKMAAQLFNTPTASSALEYSTHCSAPPGP